MIQVGFFSGLESTIILTQMVAHYILHIFLIRMTPFFFKFVESVAKLGHF